MVKQGWKRIEKLGAPKVKITVEGTMKPNSSSFEVSVTKRTVSNGLFCLNVTNETAGGTLTNCIICGYCNELPSCKATLKAFSEMWNRGLLIGSYYSKAEDIRERLGDAFIACTKKYEDVHDVLGDNVDSIHIRKFIIDLDGNNNIIGWTEK